METANRLRLAPSVIPAHKLADYTYLPLPTLESIRILRLHAGRFSDPIFCSFSLSSLPTPGASAKHGLEYEAVSYVWGDRTSTADIDCDGYRLTVPRSLHKFLRRLRHQERYRALWADAICINQQDLAEKTVQVNIMGRIFQNAKRTLFCLSDSEPALSLKGTLNRIVLYRGFIQQCESILGDEGQSHQITPCIKTLQRLGDATFGILKEVLDLEWFHRAWIVQEFGLAKDGVFIWGSEEIPKDDLLGLVKVLCNFAPNICRQHKTLNEVQQAYNMMTSYTETHIQLRYEDSLASFWHIDSTKIELSFMQILNKIRDSGCKATLEVDHLYAFFGHPKAKIRGKHRIDINYFRRPEETFQEFAMHCLEREEGLMLLSCVYHEAKIIEDRTDAHWIPSWAPRWNIPNPYMELGGVLGSNFYHAGIHQRHRWALHRFTVNGDELHVSGHVVGNVKTALRACREEHFTDELFPRTRDILTAVVAEELGRHPGDAFMTNLLTGGRIGKWPSVSAPALFQLHPAGSTNWGDAPSAYQKSVQEDAQTFCRGRSFFTTNSGGFGFGPHILEEGDICCVIHGAYVPMILRETPSGNFLLVGEAYLEGIMFGSESCPSEERQFVLV
jgi:hypothetical protein